LRYCESQHEWAPVHMQATQRVGESMEHEEGERHEIRVLDTRVQQGQTLELTDNVRELLSRAAPTQWPSATLSKGHANKCAMCSPSRLCRITGASADVSEVCEAMMRFW
jgi:hypothetical protein